MSNKERYSYFQVFYFFSLHTRIRKDTPFPCQQNFSAPTHCYILHLDSRILYQHVQYSTVLPRINITCPSAPLLLPKLWQKLCSTAPLLAAAAAGAAAPLLAAAAGASLVVKQLFHGGETSWLGPPSVIYVFIISGFFSYDFRRDYCVAKQKRLRIRGSDCA